MADTKPASGKLLIAEPFMDDDNFKRAVVLLCAHNEDGSFGLVLNRPSEHRLADAVPECESFDAPLYFGGPVEPNTLHYIHNYGDLLKDSVKIADGLYWGGSFEQLQTLINTRQIDPQQIRFFIGYSGWDPNQLTEEMKTNSWIVANCLPEYVFSNNPNKIWHQVLTDMGGNFKVIANMPENPSLN